MLGSDDAGSNYTGLKSVSGPGPESIECQTYRQKSGIIIYSLDFTEKVYYTKNNLFSVIFYL
jgi:hypothetical protein